MSNTTISSAQSYTLSSTLTSGTNIEFAGVGGTLTIEPAAVTATGLGGTIGNFRPGDFLTIDNAQEIISVLGYPGDAGYAALLNGYDLVIAPDGSVTSDSSLYGPPFVNAKTQAQIQTIANEIEHDLFGPGGLTAPLTLSVIADTGYNDLVVSSTADINACYAAGTQIRTPDGEVCIEALRIGDSVLNLDGHAQPILWLGHRTIDCARHPNPQAVWPVFIRQGAFADNVPARDLFVSPGHSLYAEGKLMQAENLVNGTTILQVQVPRVTYWHLELAKHSIVFAESLPAETYLDTGNRGAFINGGPYIEAHPDFRPKHWAETCVPLVFDGPEMQAAKTALLARAAELGYKVTRADDLHIIADGERCDPVRLSDERAAFLLPAGCDSITLVSRTFIPARINPKSRDGRALGIRVKRLQLDGKDIAMNEDAVFKSGWHHLEPHANSIGARWTTGVTQIASSTRLVVIEFGGRGYYWTNKESAEIEKPKQMAFAHRL